MTLDEHADLDAASVPGAETFPPAGHEQSETSPYGRPLGARLTDDGRCHFRVWAPERDRVELHIVAPRDRRVPLTKSDDGYHEAVVDDCAEGTRYLYVLDGGDERPDPASRHQPDGVHGPSEVVGSAFEWHDDGWKGLPLEEQVIYELHVGTFTPEGTFDAMIDRLDGLKALGVNSIELLPIAQFPGERNWGYDGTYAGAVHHSYGGPAGLKRLVDACHQRGLAVLLDVVYNHLGPEGNYLGQFGPYFTDRYKTPWGLALNFDGPLSDHVRWYFIHSALQFIDEFHFDGLRVDAVHAIVDHSAEPFLQDLTAAVRERGEELGRQVFTIAESDLNDPRVITPKDAFGIGFDAQWSDDFHHSLHTVLTGESGGYYDGFGKPSDLARVLHDGYLFTGQHSRFRGRKYGAKPRSKNGAQFVVCSQNHDQVGNRMMGERLITIAGVEKARLAAAATLLSPFVPMLFMGEEYGETAPFQYFTSHSDRDLIEAVRNGRRAEFEAFAWQGEAPDPDAQATFERSKLQWRSDEESTSMRVLYTELLRLRREYAPLRVLDLEHVETHANDELGLLVIRRWAGEEQVLIVFNFSDEERRTPAPFGHNAWRRLIESSASNEKGELVLPPVSFGVFGAVVNTRTKR